MAYQREHKNKPLKKAPVIEQIDLTVEFDDDEHIDAPVIKIPTEPQMMQRVGATLRLGRSHLRREDGELVSDSYKGLKPVNGKGWARDGQKGSLRCISPDWFLAGRFVERAVKRRIISRQVRDVLCDTY